MSSAAELQMALEDREQAISNVDLDLSPLVGDNEAYVEWVASATHRNALIGGSFGPCCRRFPLGTMNAERVCMGEVKKSSRNT